MRGWAENNGYEISHADMYFDKNSEGTGNKKVCASRLNLRDRGMIEPDGIFILKRGDAIAPIIVEIHHSDNTARITQQLNNHAYGIYIGAIRQKYGINVNPIILSIYDKAHIMLTVQKRLREADGFGTYMKGFAFNTLEQVQLDFANGWSYADMKPALIFAGK